MARKSSNTALNAIASGNNSGILDNKLTKAITYIAGTTGLVASTTLATVTGTVSMSIIAVNTGGTTIAGPAATIEVGTALSTAGLLPQITATDYAASEIWHDATVDSSIELSSVIIQKIVTQDILHEIKTAVVTGGTISYYIMWSPISQDGNVVLV